MNILEVAAVQRLEIITSENFSTFAEKIEIGQKEFIPMLPFVKNEFHNFDLYKKHNGKGTYIIDHLDGGYCLYYVYHLPGDPETLRMNLILPSSWERRVEIIEESFPHVIEWFKREDISKRFLVQVLEYGELIVFPTLDQYIIPTLLKNAFQPEYKMYMRREGNAPLTLEYQLPDGLKKVEKGENLLERAIDFYYNNSFSDYLINCSKEEVYHFSVTDSLFEKTAIFIENEDSEIVAGIFSTQDDGSYIYPGSYWMENFAVHPDYIGLDLGKYLLQEELKLLQEIYSGEDVIAYVTRDSKKAVAVYETLGFVPFEFWVDANLYK